MRKSAFILSFLVIANSSFSQDCTKIHVDVLKGTINGLSPAGSQAEVKQKFPCFSNATPDGSSANCGGGVFFMDQQFYFYTGKDNINIRKGFKGTCSIELLGKTEKEAIALLGKPEGDITDDDGARFVFFKQSYGCIVIGFDDAGMIDQFFMYATPADKVDLCV